MPPRYPVIEGGYVRLLSSDDGGALLRVIAGDIDGHRGPGFTHTPITLAHATTEDGARINIGWRRDFNALLYVLSGSGYVGPVAHPDRQSQMAVLGSGDRITLGAQQTRRSSGITGIDVLLLDGQPIRELAFHYQLLVMNSRTELIEALQDQEAGEFGTIPPNALFPHRGGGTL